MLPVSYREPVQLRTSRLVASSCLAGIIRPAAAEAIAAATRWIPASAGARRTVNAKLPAWTGRRRGRPGTLHWQVPKVLLCKATHRARHRRLPQRKKPPYNFRADGNHRRRRSSAAALRARAVGGKSAVDGRRAQARHRDCSEGMPDNISSGRRPDPTLVERFGPQTRRIWR